MDVKGKSPKAAGPIVDTAVLLAHNRTFFVDTRVPVQHAAGFRVHARNAVVHAAIVRVHNEGAVLHTRDLVVDTKERFVHTCKRVLHPKVPGVHKQDLCVDNKACVQDNDVLMQDNSATRALGENPFVQLFSPRVMHEFPSVMHEEKSKDAFSVGKVHPPAILHTFSAFVRKQRAFVRNPASAVNNDDTVQRTAVAGREGMARHPETCDACMLRGGRLTGCDWPEKRFDIEMVVYCRLFVSVSQDVNDARLTCPHAHVNIGRRPAFWARQCQASEQMPNCDFYATPVDHESILSWLFAEGTCHVYELSSEFERPLQRFSSSAEVIAQFDRRYDTGEKWNSVYLQLYVLGAGPSFTPRRVSLNPQACNGATYRFAAEGWGLVQLYLESPTQHGLNNSHSNHFTQKGAAPWESVIRDQPDTGSWDFKRITSFSSRLNREIRKRSVAKLGSRPVLPDALKLWQQGVPMLPFTDVAMKVDQRAEAVSQE